MNSVFTTPPRPPDAQRALVVETYKANRSVFATRQQARNFLRHAFAPKDLSWVFKTNAKAGATTVFAYLFEIEFGVPFTTRFSLPTEPNTDTAAHRLRDAHVFRTLLEHEGAEDPAQALKQAVTFTTVRHPATRAVSSFRYICKANAIGSDRFLSDRLRLSAITGFDWDRHPDTPEGFIRFLEFIKAETPNTAIAPVNAHWAPQVLNVQPDILKPDLIGKLEDLPAFFAALSARLNKPQPATPHRNQQAQSTSPLLDDKRSQALISEIYATDFESFGYDP